MEKISLKLAMKLTKTYVDHYDHPNADCVIPDILNAWKQAGLIEQSSLEKAEALVEGFANGESFGFKKGKGHRSADDDCIDFIDDVFQCV